MAEQEATRSERAASRARQAFALAAGFFAIVQTVVFGSFAQGAVSHHEREWMLALAAVAGGVLLICGVMALVADRAWRARHLSADQVLDAVNADEPASYGLAELYAAHVTALRSANKKRGLVAAWTQIVAVGVLLAVVVELLYGLRARS